MAIFETVLKSDLKKPVQVRQLSGNLFSADNGGNKITVEVLDNGSPATLSGGVTGYIIRADNATVTVTGSISGNKASIVLPASAYMVVGNVSIVVKVGTTTVGACTSYVYRTTTDTLVDPGQVVPSIEELLALIGDTTAAKNAANNAASLANTKAELADEKATLADTKAGLANTAAGAANAAAEKIDNMTVSVVALAEGESPTVTITEVNGHKHITFGVPKGDTGEAFHIVKTYDSVSAMNADYSGTDVKAGEYVMVVSNVENPDNAMVYIKGSEEYNFIVDMSGSAGIQGQSAYVHIRFAEDEPTQDSDVKTTPDAWIGIYSGTSSTAPTSYQSYTWYQFKGDKGDKGDTGATGATGAAGADGADGADGASAYVHIRWAANQPSSDSDMKTTADDWMGIYSGSSSTAPTSYQSYTWVKVKGETGSAANVYGNTIEMSPNDSTKVGEAIALKITAPATPGTSGQVLTSDGNGGQSWETPSGGTVTDVQEDGTSILNNGVANIRTMTGAGSSAAGTKGLVPAPASGDQGKFLKGDGTWDDVPDPQVMTGATSSAGGTSGLVPASQAGDQHKVLTASGTWQVSPGAKLVTVEMTALVNESGSYSEVTYDERITPDMKPVMVEISNEYAFRDTIYIVPGNGQATLNCANVSGSSTVTVTFQKVISDPTAVTSTEFDILNNRLMAVENVCTRHNVTIATTDWSSTAPYTYEWESSLINATCSVKVFVRDGAEDAEIEGIGYTQAVGKVIFTTDELPVDDLPLLVEITNAKAEAFQQLSAEEISSEAITGCDNVEEALGGLGEQIATVNNNKQSKLKTGSFTCAPQANTAVNVKSNYTGTLPTTQNALFVVTQCSTNNNCQVTFHWDVDNNASGALYVVSNVTQTIWVRWFSL